MSFAKRQYEKWLDENPEEVEDLNEEAKEAYYWAEYQEWAERNRNDRENIIQTGE